MRQRHPPPTGPLNHAMNMRCAASGGAFHFHQRNLIRLGFDIVVCVDVCVLVDARTPTTQQHTSRAHHRCAHPDWNTLMQYVNYTMSR